VIFPWLLSMLCVAFGTVDCMTGRRLAAVVPKVPRLVLFWATLRIVEYDSRNMPH